MSAPAAGANAFHSTEWARALEEAFPQYRLERWSAVRDGERAGLWAGFSFAPAPFLSFFRGAAVEPAGRAASASTALRGGH